KTRPIATRTPAALSASGQTWRTLPSLARTRETAPLSPASALVTHMSAPSLAQKNGDRSTYVRATASPLRFVHHCPSAARREERASAWLSPFATKTDP